MEIKKFLALSPTFSMITSAQKVSGLLNEKLSSLNLTYFQALALTAIFFEQSKSVRPKDLCEGLNTSKASISQIISTLEAEGLVKRKLMKKDSRGVEIQITKKGETTMASVVPIFEQLQEKIEREFGYNEVGQVITKMELLKKLHY